MTGRDVLTNNQPPSQPPDLGELGKTEIKTWVDRWERPTQGTFQKKTNPILLEGRGTSRIREALECQFLKGNASQMAENLKPGH